MEPFAPGCRCEIESSVDAAIMPGFDTLNRAWLACAMLMLRGHGRHQALACSAYSWSMIAGHQGRTSEVFREQMQDEGVEAAVYRPRRDLPPFKGGLLDYHVKMLVVEEEERPVSTADSDWIRQNFNRFNSLAAESERFGFALMACVDWRYLGSLRAAVARLWSGIEAVIAVQSELVFRVSLILASLLTKRGEERIHKFQQIRRLYGARSKAVHGDNISDKELAKAVAESYELLRQLLTLQVERGQPFSADDFDRAVMA